MSLEKISSVTGTALAVSGNDIDTDRIIPARFMKCVTFDGLGEFAFYDERDFASKDGRTHPFDEPERANASILVSGVNFGCGSSREHALNPFTIGVFEELLQGVLRKYSSAIRPR